MLNHYLTLLRDEKDLFGAQQPCLDTFFFIQQRKSLNLIFNYFLGDGAIIWTELIFNG